MAKRKSSITAPDLKIGPGVSNLSSLFAAGTSRDTAMQRPIMIGIESLQDNPYQPRLEVNEASLDELAEVIKQQGFQGVLVARRRHGAGDTYELTAGHRRREAARRAGLRVLPVVVQELTDEEMVVRAITENIQREDLSPLEEGKIYLVMQQELSYSYRQIAREVGKALGYVQNRIRAAQAPSDVQEMVRARPETLHAVRYLKSIDDEVLRGEIIAQLIAGSLTNDNLRSYIELSANLPSTQSPTASEAHDEALLLAESNSVQHPDTATSGDHLRSASSEPTEETTPGMPMPATPTSLDGPLDTGPLLVPKLDGSGGYLVMHSQHAKSYSSSPLSLPDPNTALDGNSKPLAMEQSNSNSQSSFTSSKTSSRESSRSMEGSAPGLKDLHGSPNFGVPRETEGLSHFRLRRSKLATAVRALRSYRGTLTSDEPLTKEEREYLQEIISLAAKALDSSSMQ